MIINKYLINIQHLRCVQKTWRNNLEDVIEKKMEALHKIDNDLGLKKG